jgi:ATP-dependent helicase Lhr and Lhr-like helicase
MSQPTNTDELTAELQRHDEIRDSLTASWSAFFARFGRLRPIQMQAIPGILRGENALVTAPTAGGKTEAVVAPVCERLVRERWLGLSVLLVTPTRALVNDLYERLSRPLFDMGIALARKTADHQVGKNSDAQFVITTPESLESFLTFKRDALKAVRVVIFDEIHLLDGTSRGDHLRLLINRLRLYSANVRGAEPPLQLIAVSATLANPRQTADRYLGGAAAIISVPGQRAIESVVITTDGDDEARALAALTAAQQIEDVHKILIFCNSRRAVDTAGTALKVGKFSGYPIHCHHGSLSKQTREQAEQRFKTDSHAVCVATMTLEIGIDIGDVDLVVCLSPPPGLGSFLQRIGRGCRRRQGVTRVICVARDRADELVYAAMLQAARSPMPEGPMAPFRRSVLLQQVLAYLRQVDGNRRTLVQLERALTHSAVPVMDKQKLDSVLRDMKNEGLLTIQNGVYEPASDGRGFIESVRIFSNIGASSQSVEFINSETGMPISSAASVGTGVGDGVMIAGKSYKIVGEQAGKFSLLPDGDSSTTPLYATAAFHYAYDVGASLATYCQFAPSRLAVLQAGDSLFVMTWLGILMNTLLAKAAEDEKVQAKGRCFSVEFRHVAESDLLQKLQASVRRAVSTGIMAEVPVEKLVDIGPHFSLLSPEEQSRARADWLDKIFLQQWCDGLNKIEVISPEDSRYADLMSLATVR